ncbi:hypothetical protein PR048_005129 [Dryococelus australis]|uniref:Uncharacterized protein n=1 Tax=Dryococelus australis TaxID=614101 RepID=A0ABQ9I7C4_9NEOP|nr:hypothetical protein PR048_005129 [Dryococelus australis]
MSKVNKTGTVLTETMDKVECRNFWPQICSEVLTGQRSLVFDPAKLPSLPTITEAPDIMLAELAREEIKKFTCHKRKFCDKLTSKLIPLFADPYEVNNWVHPKCHELS